MSTLLRIPINPVNPFPLGRHVEHDDRSRGFEYVDPRRWSIGEANVPAPKDMEWPRRIPILDQSNLLAQGVKLAGNPDSLSSCTGNAGIGIIGTSPYWVKQGYSLRKALKDPLTAEIHAIDLYAEATELDEFPDTYPPTDDGSSGLGVAKALVQQNLITGYDHIFTGVTGIVTALQSAPVTVGTNWYESMFTPNNAGVLSISGAVAGGHQYVLDAVYIRDRLFRMVNSWNPSWGDGGCAFMSWDTADRLMGEQGDAMVFRA